MSSATHGRRIRLLDIEPDLGRFLSEDERLEFRALMLPVIRASRGEREIAVDPVDRQAFGALVVEGMLIQRLRLGDHETMRLIGPGDLIALEEPRPSTAVASSGRSVIAEARLAVLGSDFLNAARRWPALVAALHVRSAEQAERISAQLAICQLPRVADRLLAMMWLLAETWGRVTPAGVTLPLGLTHEALGALIGARRPTVSLAVAELAERGSLVRQPRHWLLLEKLPEAGANRVHADAPVVLELEDSPWREPAPAQGREPIGPMLLDTVDRLRSEFRQSREEFDRRLEEVRRGRERVRRARESRADHPVTRRQAPSSG